MDLSLFSSGLFYSFWGYFIIFVLMIAGGPLFVFSTAFAASEGYFNIWIILFLSLFCTLLPDMFFFELGIISRTKSLENIISKFKMVKNQTIWIEKNLHKHFIKTVFIVKMVPFIAIPGLFLMGFLKTSRKRYFFVVFLINTISSLFLVILGFYSGKSFALLLNYLKLTQYFLAVVVVLFVLLYFLARIISKKFVNYMK